MKVLQVVASLAPEWGGPVKVVNELTHALEAYGVSSEIVSAQGRRIGKPDAIANGAQIRVFNTGPLARLWTGHAPGISKALARTIPEFDLVHIHELWHHPGYVASRIARSVGVPYIVTIHGELNQFSLRHKWLKKKIYMLAVQRRVLQRATVLHAVTRAEAERIRQLGFEPPVEMIPNGIHNQEFKDLPDPSAFIKQYPELAGKLVVLFLGRIQEGKGLDILARAFASLTRRRNDVRLVVAGPDENGTLPQVKAILKSRDVLDKTVFPGMLSGQRKLEALSAADVFALTSHSEGFSMALLEALSAGLPVLITHGCNFPEVEEAGAGFAVEPDDNEVSYRLGALLDSSDLRRKMSENAHQLVRLNYTWDSIAENMAELYARVVSQKLPERR